jgi:hypothetical protein
MFKRNGIERRETQTSDRRKVHTMLNPEVDRRKCVDRRARVKKTDYVGRCAVIAEIDC